MYSVYSTVPPPPPPTSSQFHANASSILSMQQMSTMIYDFQRLLREFRELRDAPPPVTQYAYLAPATTVVSTTAPALAFSEAMQQTLVTFMMDFMHSQQHQPSSPPPLPTS